MDKFQPFNFAEWVGSDAEADAGVDRPARSKRGLGVALAGDPDRADVSSMCLKRNTKHVYRRAFSETKLLDILERDFTPDASHHVISGGDIDSFKLLEAHRQAAAA